MAIALGALALACGSKNDDSKSTAIEGAPLDCAWLASDNCWKTTVAAAASCVPPESSAGQLSADGTSCTYASGTAVHFDTPVVLPIDPMNSPQEWHFEETSGTGSCVAYDWRENDSQTLTVQGMTYTDKAIGFGLQVTCPDGSKYAAQNALDLLECDDFFTDSPGYEDPSSDSSITFRLNQANTSTLTVFTCAR